MHNVMLGTSMCKQTVTSAESNHLDLSLSSVDSTDGKNTNYTAERAEEEPKVQKSYSKTNIKAGF